MAQIPQILTFLIFSLISVSSFDVYPRHFLETLNGCFCLCCNFYQFLILFYFVGEMNNLLRAVFWENLPTGLKKSIQGIATERIHYKFVLKRDNLVEISSVRNLLNRC